MGGAHDAAYQGAADAAFAQRHAFHCGGERRKSRTQGYSWLFDRSRLDHAAPRLRSAACRRSPSMRRSRARSRRRTSRRRSNLRVRAALRRGRERQARPPRRKPPATVRNTAAQAADRNPYADPAAPYKADRLASPKFSRADRQYAEVHHGPHQGTARGQGRHQHQRSGAHHGRRDARDRRGRQCLWRPLLHPRLRRAQ